MVGQALRWLFKADAPFRVAPRLDFALLEWLLQFAHRCTWADFKRITAAKAPLLRLAREGIEELIRSERMDCEFEATGTLNVYRDTRAIIDGKRETFIDTLRRVGHDPFKAAANGARFKVEQTA